MSTTVQLLCKIFQICNSKFLHDILEYLHHNCTIVLTLVTCLLDVVDFPEGKAGHSVIWSFHKFVPWLKMKLDCVVSKYFVVEVSYLCDQSNFGDIPEEFGGHLFFLLTM